MEAKDKALLADNIDLLMGTHNIDQVIDELRQRKVLSPYVVGQLNMISNEDHKIGELYEEIKCRGPSAMEHLLSALAFTGNETIANTLNQKKYGVNNQYLKIKVIKSKTRLDVNHDPSKPARVYRMGSKPKGYALIININKFFIPGIAGIAKETRDGSYRDVANMYTLLHQLGYEVTMLYNLTQKEIKKKVANFARMPEHLAVDSTIVVVMSHGGERDNTFLSYDCQEVHCERDIVAQFNSRLCPHLNGKPKIFVFQVCRGDRRDFGIDSDVTGRATGGATSSPTDGVTTTDSARPFLSSNCNQPVAQPQSTNNEPVDATREPSVNNIFQIYSTGFDFESLRDPIKGGFLVHYMCLVFAENAHKWDLYNLVRETTKRINKNYDKFHGFMTPHFCGSADFGKFYFNPGLYDQSAVSGTHNNSRDNDNNFDNNINNNNDVVYNAEFTFSNQGNRLANRSNSSSNIDNARYDSICNSNNTGNYSVETVDNQTISQNNADVDKNSEFTVASHENRDANRNSSYKNSINCVQDSQNDVYADKMLEFTAEKSATSMKSSNMNRVDCDPQNLDSQNVVDIDRISEFNIGSLEKSITSMKSSNNNISVDCVQEYSEISSKTNVGSNVDVTVGSHENRDAIVDNSSINCVQKGVSSEINCKTNENVGITVGSHESKIANINSSVSYVGKSVDELMNGKNNENRCANSNSDGSGNVVSNSSENGCSNSFQSSQIVHNIENSGTDARCSFEKHPLNSQVPVGSFLSTIDSLENDSFGLDSSCSLKHVIKGPEMFDKVRNIQKEEIFDGSNFESLLDRNESMDGIDLVDEGVNEDVKNVANSNNSSLHSENSANKSRANHDCEKTKFGIKNCIKGKDMGCRNYFRKIKEKRSNEDTDSDNKNPKCFGVNLCVLC